MDSMASNGIGASGMGSFGLNYGSSAAQNEDNMYTIVQADVNISNKTMAKSSRPCQAYIEIEFRKDNETPYFSYLVFQNFYCHQITIKQYVGKQADRKDEKNWRTILKNFNLMSNPHFETDAQNGHIVGAELVSKSNNNDLPFS